MPKQKNWVILTLAAAVFVVIVVSETVAPANIVGAYAFVLPILLVATLHSRPLMLATVVACVAATWVCCSQRSRAASKRPSSIERSWPASC